MAKIKARSLCGASDPFHYDYDKPSMLMNTLQAIGAAHDHGLASVQYAARDLVATIKANQDGVSRLADGPHIIAKADHLDASLRKLDDVGKDAAE